jgi:hypothetical protein
MFKLDLTTLEDMTQKMNSYTKQDIKNVKGVLGENKY